MTRRNAIILLVTFLWLPLLVRAEALSHPLERLALNKTVLAGEGVNIHLTLSMPGTLALTVVSQELGISHTLFTLGLGAGEAKFSWDGTLSGARVGTGTYTLCFAFTDREGIEYPEKTLVVQVPPVSTPYSDLEDGTFWSLRPGEPDDAAVWAALMQPITVYDNYSIGASGHAYLVENPDGTGRRVCQLHGLSQGVHVLGEENEYGYALVESFSNYDPTFTPQSEEAKAHAFDVKQGYVKASALKTVHVNQNIGLVVDKLTQRLYIYINGKRAGELMVSTGLITEGKYYRETPPGEYITIDTRGEFWQDGLLNQMGIRYSGGNLIHLVPCEVSEEGKRDYSAFEKYLGEKRSGGCVRVQREKNVDGFSHQWLWDNLDKNERYKVIIWDDLNR